MIAGEEEILEEETKSVECESTKAAATNETETTDETEATNEYVEDESAIVQWLKTLDNRAKKLVKNNGDGDRDNIMYNPEFAKFILRLAKLLPLWSCINCNDFDIMEEATSAHSESHFADLKHSMRGSIPCRIDDFVQKHIDIVDGMVKKASQKYITFIDASEMTTGKKKLFYTIVNIIIIKQV